MNDHLILLSAICLISLLNLLIGTRLIVSFMRLLTLLTKLLNKFDKEDLE